MDGIIDMDVEGNDVSVLTLKAVDSLKVSMTDVLDEFSLFISEVDGSDVSNCCVYVDSVDVYINKSFGLFTNSSKQGSVYSSFVFVNNLRVRGESVVDKYVSTLVSTVRGSLHMSDCYSSIVVNMELDGYGFIGIIREDAFGGLIENVTLEVHKSTESTNDVSTCVNRCLAVPSVDNREFASEYTLNVRESYEVYKHEHSDYAGVAHVGEGESADSSMYECLFDNGDNTTSWTECDGSNCTHPYLSKAPCVAVEPSVRACKSSNTDTSDARVWDFEGVWTLQRTFIGVVLPQLRESMIEHCELCTEDSDGESVCYTCEKGYKRSSDGGCHKDETALIVGIVVSVLVVGAAVGVTVFFVTKKKDTKVLSREEQNEGSVVVLGESTSMCSSSEDSEEANSPTVSLLKKHQKKR